MKALHKNISKRKNKRCIKIIIWFIIIEIITLNVFVFAICDTTTANAQNTYQVKTEITDIQIKDIPNKNSMLYLKTPNNSYRLVWKNYDENSKMADINYVKNQLSTETDVVFTVLKDSEKASVVYGDTLQVVDIQSDTTTYYDIINYNQWQNNNRIVIIAFFVLVEIILIIIFIITLLL